MGVIVEGKKRQRKLDFEKKKEKKKTELAVCADRGQED